MLYPLSYGGSGPLKRYQPQRSASPRAHGG